MCLALGQGLPPVCSVPISCPLILKWPPSPTGLHSSNPISSMPSSADSNSGILPVMARLSSALPGNGDSASVAAHPKEPPSTAVTRISPSPTGISAGIPPRTAISTAAEKGLSLSLTLMESRASKPSTRMALR